ncbi:hypothetical protein V501_00791 [Pseudogymnoascus sp. VKM F-4519 (FW-2642)]|nr:hypothetical protein V501_00791 [Pseudogymnoascus sp. VKM F-4519 (FW-2642)]
MLYLRGCGGLLTRCGTLQQKIEVWLTSGITGWHRWQPDSDDDLHHANIVNGFPHNIVSHNWQPHPQYEPQFNRENKGPISYCQQIKESLQHQRAEDESIVVAPPLRNRQHSAKPYHKDDEDNEDDEDEDVRPLRRRKRCRIESDATQTATRKKVHTRSSTIAQAQNRTARESTVSQSPLADTESILGRTTINILFRAFSSM